MVQIFIDSSYCGKILFVSDWITSQKDIKFFKFIIEDKNAKTCNGVCFSEQKYPFFKEIANSYEANRTVKINNPRFTRGFSQSIVVCKYSSVELI